MSIKKFTFGALSGKSLVVNIPEVVDPTYGMYVWPCAPVLAQYVWFNRNYVKDRLVLELGAGTALPGIVAAKLGAKVTLSDATHLPLCLENCAKSCTANQLTDVKIIELTWGQFEPDLLALQPQDIVLGSDCFYDTKDFEDILATVAHLMKQNDKCQFWTTYQQRRPWLVQKSQMVPLCPCKHPDFICTTVAELRNEKVTSPASSGDRCLGPLLIKWGLQCTKIPLPDFDADGPSLAGSELPGQHDIEMLVVTKSRRKGEEERHP